MCNLYSLTKGQQAIRDLAGAMRDVTGNLPLFPGIFPDYAAPIVRNAPDGVRELSTARWGMPSPVFALKGRNSDPGVTNVRNVSSPHARQRAESVERCWDDFGKVDLGDEMNREWRQSASPALSQKPPIFGPKSPLQQSRILRGVDSCRPGHSSRGSFHTVCMKSAPRLFG